LNQQPLEIGILLDSIEVPAWQYHLIQVLTSADYASVKFLLLENAHAAAKKSKATKLYDFLEHYDAMRQSSLSDPCATKTLEGFIGSDEFIRASLPPISSKPQNATSARKSFGNHEFDVILALGALQSVEHFCAASKYGVWYFWHGCGRISNDNASHVGFWDVLNRHPHIYSALLIQTIGKAEKLIAYESYSGVDYLSFTRSRNEHLWKMLFFAPRALKQMHYKGAEQFLLGLRKTFQSKEIAGAKANYHFQHTRVFALIVSYAGWRIWQKLIRKLYSEKWMLAFTLSGNSEDFSKFTVLRPPDGRFWADPHVLQRNKEYYVFFEDASVISGHGHIAFMRMNNEGICSTPTSIIRRPYHLSYPFIFSWNSEIYLIPESAENRSVELYHCKTFPTRWEFSHNLMNNLFGYDASLVNHGDLWWMFINVKSHKGASPCDELCLFYSDSPISKHWHPHPMNPIVSDVRRARPAGRILVENGHLYRPSQDSSKRYGHALNISKIKELTTTSYSEELVQTFLPNWSKSVLGVHTISRADDLVMIDAIYRSFRRR
jgi:hypothetical protein